VGTRTREPGIRAARLNTAVQQTHFTPGSTVKYINLTALGRRKRGSERETYPMALPMIDRDAQVSHDIKVVPAISLTQIIPYFADDCCRFLAALRD
jgi:hypothetical protein